MKSRRTSQLGLDFLYLRQKSRPHADANQNVVKECISCRSRTGMESSSRRGNETEQTAAEKAAIREYMRKKRCDIVSYERDREKLELQRRNRINDNKNRLERLVKQIFSNVPSRKPSEKPKPRRGHRKSAGESPVDEYDLLFSAIDVESKREQRKPQVTVMDGIKAQLMKELGPGLGSRGTMQRSQSQPDVRKKPRRRGKTQKRQSSKKKAERKRREAIVRIQSHVRGFLVRKRCRGEMLGERFIQEVQRKKEADASSSFSELPAVEAAPNPVDLAPQQIEANIPTQNAQPDLHVHNKPKPAVVCTFACPEVLSIIPTVKGPTPEPSATEIPPTEKKPALVIETSLGTTQFLSPAQANIPSAAASEELKVPPRRLLESPVAPDPEREQGNDSIQPEEEATNSMFDRNAFGRFAAQRFGNPLDGMNLSRLVKMRERAISYREKTERKYIRKLYKEKQISPHSYQSKRKELERWVFKEREEIKRTKSHLADNWKKTAQMIEDAQANAQRIRQFFLQHAASYISDNNSTPSHFFDGSRQATLDAECEGITALEREAGCPLSVPVPDAAEHTAKPAAILIQENSESQPTTAVHGSPVDSSNVESHPTVQSVFVSTIGKRTLISPSKKAARPQNVAEQVVLGLVEDAMRCTIRQNWNEARANLESKKAVGEEITEFLLDALLKEATTEPFPRREPPVPKALSLQALAMRSKKSAASDLYHVNDYLDELFVEVFTEQKQQFVGDINRPIVRVPLEVLGRLQNPEQKENEHTPLPHEISPVLALDTYLEVEKNKEMSKPTGSELVAESEHIHNKSIFDAVNEALNLIRPYGMTGQPMPWSLAQRVLFTKIADPNIIVRNIKNIVYVHAKRAG